MNLEEQRGKDLKFTPKAILRELQMLARDIEHLDQMAGFLDDEHIEDEATGVSYHLQRIGRDVSAVMEMLLEAHQKQQQRRKAEKE